MASVRKREWTHKGEDKSAWVVSYTDQGGKRHIKTFDKKKDADRYRTQVETEIERGDHTPASQTMTVAQAAAAYLEQCRRRHRDGDIGQARLVGIELALRKHIVSALGATLYADLTAFHIRGWYDRLPDHLSLRSRRMYLAEFSALDVFANRQKITRRTVVKDFREDGLRGKGRVPIATFSMESIRALVAAMQVRPHYAKTRAWERLKLAVQLALFCGLRRGEIYGLTLPSIDFDRGVIKVRNSLTAWGELKGPKTAAGVRDVPMPEPLAEALQAWLARYYVPNDQDLVLSATRGHGRAAGCVDMVKSHQKEWRALLVRAGLHVEGSATGKGLHFHALRHFASSWYLSQQMSPPDVAKLLGHSSFDVTLQVYAHPVYDDSYRRAAINSASAKLIALAAPVIDATTV